MISKSEKQMLVKWALITIPLALLYQAVVKEFVFETFNKGQVIVLALLILGYAIWRYEIR